MKQGPFSETQFVEHFLAHDRHLFQGQASNIKGYSLIGFACAAANKYRFADSMVKLVEQHAEMMPSETIAIRPDMPSLWIEAENSILSFCGQVKALFFFPSEREYRRWQLGRDPLMQPKRQRRQKRKAQPWQLTILSSEGDRLIKFIYDGANWYLPTEHRCPMNSCKRLTRYERKRSNIPLHVCSACRSTLVYWRRWLAAAIELLDKNVSYVCKECFEFDIPAYGQSSITKMKHTPLAYPEKSPLAPPIQAPKPQQPLPVRVRLPDNKPLLIERYIEAQGKPPVQEALKQAKKFLWMKSAWAMSEVLSQHNDDTPLRVSADPIYIELEEPHAMAGLEIAAFSFVPLPSEDERHRHWQFSVVDPDGKTAWYAFYELVGARKRGSWTLPQLYLCPKWECRTETGASGRQYILCEHCQERMTSLTSWLSIALRMVAGDFQEDVVLREPEEAHGIGKRKVKDKEGKQKEIQILHRYRVIRYLDANVHHVEKPEGKRGSWMEGRPLATSEFEVNPDAVIYVQIYPKEHDRTYRHERYTNVKGKTQHIESKPRLQPMTIATFRQLKRVQRITRVYASKFE